MKPLKIAIIGAGTAGLASANLLAKQGHSVSVFEKFSTLKPVGAGLLLQPSGLAVFEKLGVLSHARQLGAHVVGLVGKLPSEYKVVNSFYQQAGSELYGLGIHRATLCHVLHHSLHDLPISWYFDHEVTHVDYESDSKAIITFRTKNIAEPQTTSFDLALVCNGAKSQLRPAAWTTLDKPYLWGAAWAIVPECDLFDKQVLHQFYDGASVMMGILPTGKLPHTDASNQTNALSSVFWSLPTATLNSLNKVQKRELIVRESSKRWQPVGEWLAQLDDNTQWLNAIYRDVVMTRYGQGCVGVLGDAAHAMSPQLGQGANMALLDAWAVCEAIHNNENLDDVWKHYHQLRQPSIRFYQTMSRMLTPFYQSDSLLLGKMRDLAFTFMYAFPWLRKEMAVTISGSKTGLLSQLDLSVISQQTHIEPFKL